MAIAGIITADSGYSRLARRLQRRYADDFEALSALQSNGMAGQQFGATAYAFALEALQTRGYAPDQALRVLRQWVMLRLIAMDCVKDQPGCSLDVVTTAMTELAEFALNRACQIAFAELDAQHGTPMNEAKPGQRAEFWVVGMGKLGARELNVSSDIDLIYVYDADGRTAGVAADETADETADGMSLASDQPAGRRLGRISNPEYFAKVVKRLSALIGEVTEHGFVFRVDLALRPHGNSGPPAVSLAALEAYLQTQGREWERLAWLKSRVVAPLASVRRGAPKPLGAVVLPFVFRRYLDYQVFDALRVLHRQIRDHASQRSAGHPARANDVKLSRGGIREIEFIAQVLQVVRGGRYPELRTRPTLRALVRLAHAGVMSNDAMQGLCAAYTFLRRVEHRIQYLDDLQTHVLPTDGDDLAWIARTMGFVDVPAFESDLAAHRERVAGEFDQLLGGRTATTRQSDRTVTAAQEGADFDALIAAAPAGLRLRLTQLRAHPHALTLREDARQRLVRVLWRLVDGVGQELEQGVGQGVGQDLGQGVQTEGAANLTAPLRMLDWLEPLLRRDSYLALLLERPAIQARLLRVLGAARWPARYLVRHPGVIDELANEHLLHARFDATAFEAQLQARRAALVSSHQDDDETLLDLLRQAHHAEVFRTLVRDAEGHLTVEAVADDLSALAEVILRVTTDWCWRRLKNRHQAQPLFGVIAYGKLGGKELGYGSDLDIVFVYEDEDERAPEVYSALVRKLVTWMTVKTGHGDLFEIDTALRPNGNSGLLVTTFAAYANYQLGRGSNTAWTWEHQAMTRARCVMGSEGLRARFDAVRHAVISAPRDAQALRQEIVAMRQKVRAAHPVKAGVFDVKHGVGGMVDAEFAVQYVVLAHAGTEPALTENIGNIGLLRRAQALGLVPVGIGDAAALAYRTLRHQQHRARLDEQTPNGIGPEAEVARAAITALWQAVFERPRYEPATAQ